jgi:hypothetical protein
MVEFNASEQLEEYKKFKSRLRPPQAISDGSFDLSERMQSPCRAALKDIYSPKP